MQLEKFALPLSVAASIAAIFVFLKTNSSGAVAPTMVAAFPTPLSVPTFAAIPLAQYNVATPTPPPGAYGADGKQVVTPGTGQVIYPGRAGITATRGFFGAPTALSDMPSPNGCGGCGCGDTGHDYADGSARYTYYNSAYQNSAAI